VTGALRAESIALAAKADDLKRFDSTAEGTVGDVIFEGERIVYEIAVAGMDGTVLRVFDHVSDTSRGFDSGARVHMGWNARDLLVFTN